MSAPCIGKKQKNLKPGEERQGLGDVWTFVSIAAESRMVPNYLVGKRDLYSATCFVEDLASRLNAGRVQISTDGLAAYLDAVERGFGADADYAQIVKNYGQEDIEGQRRYSPPKIIYVTKTVISGAPDRKKILNFLHRTPESHDANAHAETDPVDQCFLQEAR